MARRTRATEALPAPLLRALTKLGGDLRVARKRRRISVRQMAERMMVSVDTLVRLEKGDPRVGLGILGSALWALGMHEHLAQLVEPDRDTVGKNLELTRLPKKVRTQGADFDF